MKSRNHGSVLRRAKYVLALGALLSAGAVASGAFGMVDSIKGTTDSTSTETASAATPSISTDAGVYGPGATVTLTGSGWLSGEQVHLFVNDDQGKTWSSSADVTAEADGSFAYQFQLPSSFVAVYSVTATGSNGETATTTFQDDAVLVTFPASTTYTASSWASGCPTAGLCGTANGGNTSAVKVSIRQGSGNYWSGASFSSASETFLSTSLAPNGGNNYNWSLAFPASQFPANGPYTLHVQGFDNKGGTIKNDEASVTFTIGAAQQNTSLTVSGASGMYGGSTTLSATLTAGGSGVNSKTISFSLNGNAVGSATTNSSGTATLSGASLGGINAGSYSSGVGASFAGDGSFSGSNGTGSLTIAKTSQTITFAQPASPAAYSSSFAVNPTADSGLPVAVGVTGPCSYNGSLGTVTMTSGSGTCAITASQAGDGNHDAATSVTRNVDAAKADQTITITTHAPAGAPYNTSFGVAARASSGLLVAFSSSGSCSNSGATFTMTSGSGACTVEYDQAGDANYNAAPGLTETAEAAKTSQTITFAQPTSAAVFGSTFDVHPTSDSGLAVEVSASGACSISGSTVTMTSGSGTCTLTASQAGTDDFGAATLVRTVDAAKAEQTITFGPLADRTYGDAPFSVSATGGASGNAVTFSTLGSCSSGGTNGTTTTITGAGSCTVTADQAGDANYADAPSAAQSFTISKASSSVDVSWDDATFGGSSDPASAQVNGVGGETDLSPQATFDYYSGSSVSGSPLAGAPTNAGTYTVRASFAGNDDYSPASADKTITIAKATPRVTVDWSGWTFDAAPHAASGSVTGVADANLGAPDSFSYYSGSDASGTALASAPTDAGTYTAVAHFAGNGNYTAADSDPQTITVEKADASVAVTWDDTTYDAGSHPASAQVKGVGDETDLSPKATFEYYSGSSAAGAPLAGAPTDAGTYTVRASFAGNGNYNGAYADKTVTIAKANASVDVSWADATYDAGSHPASAQVNGVGGETDLSPEATFAYYGGSSVAGSPLAGAPTDAGTYTVRASFAGNGNYNDSYADKTITIAKATPKVTVDWSGWTFDATAHAASGSVTGVADSNLGGPDSFSYYSGSNASGTALAGAPTDAGTYTVVAHFGGSRNYTAADSDSKTIEVAKATPAVSVSWSGWTFDTNAHPASGSVTGVGSADLGSADSFNYYSGSSASGSPLAGAPSDAGTYTVVAHYGGSSNYTDADSDPKTIEVAKATPAVSASWSGWTFDGNAHPASGSVTGVGGADLGSANSFSYYSGSSASGSPLADAPSDAGMYTVVAHFDGNGNYSGADSGPKTITVDKATQSISFTAPTGVTFGDSDLDLGATASSGLPVTYTSSTSTCTIVSGKLHVGGAGSCTVTASRAGDGNYLPAADETRTFAIAKRDTSILATGAPTGGQSSVAVSALVSANGGNAMPNGGTVSFSVKNGAGTVVATASGTVSGGSAGASLAVGSLPIGNYTLLASYGGTSNFNGSSNDSQAPAATVSVQYRWDGFLQPINDTAHQVGVATSVFKAGSTVPAKLQLKRADGTVVQAATPPVWLTPLKGSAMSTAANESTYTDTATAGSSFSWDGTQYQYNWSTKGLAAGYWYKIGARFDDGQTYYVTIGLR